MGAKQERQGKNTIPQVCQEESKHILKCYIYINVFTSIHDIIVTENKDKLHIHNLTFKYNISKAVGRY
jgi:hypothetical protein